jgi:hypothetical protein
LPQPAPQPAPQNSAIALSPLNSIPSDIAFHRAFLFALDTPVRLTAAVWDRFWPYIDNVWRIHQKPQPSPETGIARVYGSCRLSRKIAYPDDDGNVRPRQRRPGGTCNAKFKLTIYPDGTRFMERSGEGHSHTLDQIDRMKRNSGVRNLVLADFFKNWEPNGILAFLRDSSAASNGKDIFRDAGGLYMYRQEVGNVLNQALKKAFPGQDISEVKKQMDKYKKYISCNYKGCTTPDFPDLKALHEHRKAVHGRKIRTMKKRHPHSAHLFPCPDIACWRHKPSKGFTTLLAMQEHAKEKHGTDAEARSVAVAYNNTIEQPTADHLSGTSASHEELALALSGFMDGMGSSLPSPITPESSGEEQQMSSENMQLSTREATQRLTYQEKEQMKVRIRRLESEKQKLDEEIKTLNMAVWGNEYGENAGDW